MALTPELRYELDRPEYENKSFADILSALQAQTTPVIGSIRGADLRNVVAILAGGLQYRLDNAPESPIRTALLTGFKNMTIPDYAFNMADPTVAYMLDIATQLGLVTPDERLQFYTLATFMKPVWPGVTIKDIVQHKQPNLIELNDWSGEIDVGRSRTGLLTVLAPLPETTNVVVEIKISDDGINYGSWMPCTIIPGILNPTIHPFNVPSFSGMTRKIRWKGTDYAVPGIVRVV
jgi:hypothetical protein